MMSPRLSRVSLRMAGRLRERLVSLSREELPSIPHSDWGHLQRLGGLFDLASTRHWDAARRRVGRETERAIRRMLGAIHELRRKIHRPPKWMECASLRDMASDLHAVGEEFGSVTFDLHLGTVTAATEPMILEAVELGPFAILISLAGLRDRPPYRVIALEPHRARSQPETTHPHIQFDRLCEGAGAEAIGRALVEGRLFDFFVLVRQVLRNYSAETAYVSLAEWEGETCVDCGGIFARAALRGCERCDEAICPGCAARCDQCQRVCCSRCRTDCTCCRDPVCDRCARKCAACGEGFCAGCVVPDACAVCRTIPGDPYADCASCLVPR